MIEPRTEPDRSPQQPGGESRAAHALGADKSPKSRKTWRLLLYLGAVAMLAGAIVMAVRGASGEQGSGFAHIADADPLDVAGIAGLILGSIILNGFVFWLIARPFETGSRVGVGEMTTLIGATSLLNYLPLRAGMVGRAAYLKRRHGISYTASVVMLLMVGGGTVYVFAVLAAATLWRGRLDGMWWACVLGGLAVGAIAAVPTARLKVRLTPGLDAPWFARAGASAYLGAALLVAARALDVVMLAGRLWLAGRIIGAPIGFPAAIVMATGGMFVKLATPLPNGLGLQEMLYGAMAEVGVAADVAPGGATGLMIGLVDRAVEAVVFILVGLVSLLLIKRAWHAGAALAEPAGGDDGGA